jgi:hypothetical protein
MFGIGLLFVQLTNSGLYTEAEGNRELSYQRALLSLAGENCPAGVTVMDRMHTAWSWQELLSWENLPIFQLLLLLLVCNITTVKGTTDRYQT